MNREAERVLKKDIRRTIKRVGSTSKKGSRSWFAENLKETLHRSLRSYTDVKAFCDNDPDAKVFGVYLRYELNQQVRVKIGKGVVYF